MLNEIYEYELYTTKCEKAENYVKKYGKRLAHKNIVHGLTGVRRPLTIIARGVLYGMETENSDQKTKNLDFDKAVACLQSWCGFKSLEGVDIARYSNLREWLPDYLRNTLSVEDDSEKNDVEDSDKKDKESKEKKANQKNKKGKESKEKKANQDKAAEVLKAKEKGNYGFNSKALKVEAGESRNDKNTINFQDILSEAINIDEPLTAYYLVADCAEAAEKEFQNDKYKYEEYIFKGIQGKPFTSEKNGFFDLDKDFDREKQGSTQARYQARSELLSLVALFLLNRKRLNPFAKKIRGQNIVPFIKTDFLHWIRQTTDASKFDAQVFCINEGGEDSQDKCIFEIENVIETMDILQLKVLDEWFTKCGWKLMTKEELAECLKNENANTLFYRDYYYDERWFPTYKNNSKEGKFKAGDPKLSENGNKKYDKPQLTKNKFYREHKEFWEEKAKENDQIKRIFKNSFEKK